MPPHPRTGWYQIRTAGNDIMHAAKTVRPTLAENVNDFMLAMLDPKEIRYVKNFKNIQNFKDRPYSPSLFPLLCFDFKLLRKIIE